MCSLLIRVVCNYLCYRPILYIAASKHSAFGRDIDKVTKFIVYMLVSYEITNVIKADLLLNVPSFYSFFSHINRANVLYNINKVGHLKYKMHGSEMLSYSLYYNYII